MVTGKETESLEPLITFGFSKGYEWKCDSMHSSTKMGLTKMIGNQYFGMLKTKLRRHYAFDSK
jgi:hypothetical protein